MTPLKCVAARMARWPAARAQVIRGLMFGYACNETEQLMPLPIHVAHRLAARLTEVRKQGVLGYLRPDGKTQVTVSYEDGRPTGIDTVVVSTQHDDGVSLRDVMLPEITREVIRPVLAEHGYDNADPRIFVNPSGKFVVGGPMGDAGVTGRKIIVDTYGGMARHGGGAFSGKDPSKVDRSASYATPLGGEECRGGGLGGPLRGAGRLRHRPGSPRGLLPRHLRGQRRCRNSR